MIVFWVFIGIWLADILAKSFLMFGTQKNWYRKKAGALEPISVIIAAHNEEENLKKNLPRLLEQNFEGEWEVIIALDRCKDNSQAFVEKLRQNHSQLRFIHIKEVPEGISPKKFALNQAIRVAEFEILAFTDADCTVGKSWLSHIAAHFFRKTEIVLGLGPYNPAPGLLGLWVRFETFYTALQYVGLAGAGFPYMGVGRNLAYRKSLFEQGGGFSGHENRLSGDDDLFVNQHAHAGNTAVMTDPGSETWSEAPEDWKAWWRQKTRHFSASGGYSFSSRIILGLLNGLQLLFFLSLPVAIFASEIPYYAGLALVARWVWLGIMLRWARPPLMESAFLFALPLLDVMLFLHFLIVAPAGMILKPKWKAD